MSAETEIKETPAENADSKPLQTAEEKALTSHLKNVELPVEDDAAETAQQEVTEIKLPKTLKATLELISETQDSRPTDIAGEKRKNLLLERLRAHAHALSQGIPAPAITGDDHTELTASHSSHAEEIHLTMLSRTDRIVADRLKRDAETIADLRAKLAAALAPKK